MSSPRASAAAATASATSAGAAGATARPRAPSDVWIFGFGSLIQNPGFEHSGRVKGFIRGYRRVFWQGSTDHRGTPAAPGRVATLTPDPTAKTWGVAYRLAGSPEEQRRTLRYLEWREKEYDQRLRVDVFEGEGSREPAVRDALLYLASSDRGANPNWVGEEPLERTAEIVASAEGPSGPNYVYLFRLQRALRDELGAADPDVDALAARVETLLRRRGVGEDQFLGASAGDHSHWKDEETTEKIARAQSIKA